MAYTYEDYKRIYQSKLGTLQDALDLIQSGDVIWCSNNYNEPQTLFGQLHTIADRTGDITIDTCFDADRMDLLRVGIKPLPDRMASKKGAELVAIPNYSAFYIKYNPAAKSFL